MTITQDVADEARKVIEQAAEEYGKSLQFCPHFLSIDKYWCYGCMIDFIAQREEVHKAEMERDSVTDQEILLDIYTALDGLPISGEQTGPKSRAYLGAVEQIKALRARLEAAERERDKARGQIDIEIHIGLEARDAARLAALEEAIQVYNYTDGAFIDRIAALIEQAK